MSTPLIMTEEARQQIVALRKLAEDNPVNMVGLTERLQIPYEKEMHMAQMTAQTMMIPMAFLVTFSIEFGHPVGPCRHLSMSVQREGRIPHPAAVWMVAKEFGFWGVIEDCEAVWNEELKSHGVAINVVQTLMRPVTASTPAPPEPSP